MRILILITRGDSIGGAQIHVLSLAKLFKQNGHDVLICYGGETEGPFNKLLIAKHREDVLPEIIPAFIQQYKEHKGIFIVKLTTAVPVSDELKNAIVDKIKSTTSMKNIELNAEVKESLIGGFVLEAAGQLVDASIAYDLNTVRKQFQNNDFIYKIR